MLCSLTRTPPTSTQRGSFSSCARKAPTGWWSTHLTAQRGATSLFRHQSHWRVRALPPDCSSWLAAALSAGLPWLKRAGCAQAAGPPLRVHDADRQRGPPHRRTPGWSDGHPDPLALVNPVARLVSLFCRALPIPLRSASSCRRTDCIATKQAAASAAARPPYEASCSAMQCLPTPTAGLSQANMSTSVRRPATWSPRTRGTQQVACSPGPRSPPSPRHTHTHTRSMPQTLTKPPMKWPISSRITVKWPQSPRSWAG